MPPEALEGVYAMHYFYYDLANFPDKAVAKSAAEFTELYRAKYKAPPDAYATIAYIAYMEMFRGFEAAKSYDAAEGVGGVDGEQGPVQDGQGRRPCGVGPPGRLIITPHSW